MCEELCLFACVCVCVCVSDFSGRRQILMWKLKISFSLWKRIFFFHFPYHATVRRFGGEAKKKTGEVWRACGDGERGTGDERRGWGTGWWSG
jgi:hypothetical protein